MNTIVLTDVDFYPVIQPILEILDAILWPAIAIVVAVGTIYCIFLGVKIAKADEQNSREKAKKDLVGAVIGFVLIFVLILALKIAVPILEDWVTSQMQNRICLRKYWYEKVLHSEAAKQKKKASAEANALFPEQVTVRAGSGQRQDELVVLYSVDEKPIGLDVAFHERFPIPG